MLRRHDSWTEIRFEPITVLGDPKRLMPILRSYMLTTDGLLRELGPGHCGQVFHVVNLLCSSTRATSAAEKTWSIVDDLLVIGEPIEGHTLRGTVPQRYEAAGQMVRPLDEHGRTGGRPRYLVEDDGEIAVMVSELQSIARRNVGATIRHGWLDARLEEIGWERVTLDAWQEAGRAGRGGHHRRFTAYRGHPSPGGGE